MLVLFVAAPALARPHVRRHFEPTDLELEEPGTTELDLEIGHMRGQDAARVITPDFEVDLGLAKWLEIDVDGALVFGFSPHFGVWNPEQPATKQRRRGAAEL